MKDPGKKMPREFSEPGSAFKSIKVVPSPQIRCFFNEKWLAMEWYPSIQLERHSFLHALDIFRNFNFTNNKERRSYLM